MSLKRIPMDTAKLRIGMYVAMLDRPWLETPFVFQGFMIKDKFEIDQLQSYCSQVFVEVERGKLTEAEIRALASAEQITKQHNVESAQSTTLPNWLQRIMLKTGLGSLFGWRAASEHGPYAGTATVRREAPKAKQAYEDCVTAYRHIFARTRADGNVNMQEVIEAVTPIIESILRNPDAMAWTVFSGKRSGRNYSRAVATSVWATMFGRHLQFDRSGLQNLAIGGLLLDIGNVALPDELLHATGAIAEREYDQVVRHVQSGIDILRKTVNVDPVVFEMLVYHHERYDGSGYPNGLRGGDITPYGRIAGIVDCYDAMTTKTSYSPALAAYDAARELNEMRDQTFHAEVVEQFLKTIGMFPTGSIVQLNDGSVALVLEQNPSNSLHPKVLLLQDTDHRKLDSPLVINEDDWRDRNLWIAKGHEHGAFGIDPMAYFN